MTVITVHRVVIAVLGSLLLAAAGVIHSPQTASQTQRFPQFENEDVKVWKSVVLPNQPLTMHRHDHPRVIIALKGGTMKIVDQSGGRGTACLGYRKGLLATRKPTRHQAC